MQDRVGNTIGKGAIGLVIDLDNLYRHIELSKPIFKSIHHMACRAIASIHDQFERD